MVTEKETENLSWSCVACEGHVPLPTSNQTTFQQSPTSLGFLFLEKIQKESNGLDLHWKKNKISEAEMDIFM